VSLTSCLSSSLISPSAGKAAGLSLVAWQDRHNQPQILQRKVQNEFNG
jgi:hypothetical protein